MLQLRRKTVWKTPQDCDCLCGWAVVWFNARLSRSVVPGTVWLTRLALFIRNRPFVFRSRRVPVALCTSPIVYQPYCIPVLSCPSPVSPIVSPSHCSPVLLCPCSVVSQSHCVPAHLCTSPMSHCVPVPLCPRHTVSPPRCAPVPLYRKPRDTSPGQGQGQSLGIEVALGVRIRYGTGKRWNYVIMRRIQIGTVVSPLCFSPVVSQPGWNGTQRDWYTIGLGHNGTALFIRAIPCGDSSGGQTNGLVRQGWRRTHADQ